MSRRQTINGREAETATFIKRSLLHFSLSLAGFRLAHLNRYMLILKSQLIFMKTVFPVIILLIFVPISACSQISQQNSKPENITVKKSPVITNENSKGKTFLAPDSSFQMEIPAYTSETVEELDSDDIKINGSGTRFIWASDKLRLTIKSVYSEHFPNSDSQSGREKFWQETLEQMKGFELQQGAEIVAERDLSSNSYFALELKEISSLKNINLSRYYYTGKRFISVRLIIADKNLENEGQKYINSFKFLK